MRLPSGKSAGIVAATGKSVITGMTAIGAIEVVLSMQWKYRIVTHTFCG